MLALHADGPLRERADRGRPVRVLVVDDSPTARRMLRLVLADLTDLVVVGEATSGEECLNRLDELAPDIVVMDWRMPGMDGAETTAAALTKPCA